jgi:hypothetical protein
MNNYPKTVKIAFPSGATVSIAQSKDYYELVYHYEGVRKKYKLKEAQGGKLEVQGRTIVKARGIYIN